MAGYDWNAGKSDNARYAEENGLRVKSKITKAWLTEGGINESPRFIKWLISEGVLGYDEWHHTSKMFNKVGYFSTESIREQLEDRAGTAERRGSIEWLRQRFEAGLPARIFPTC